MTNFKFNALLIAMCAVEFGSSAFAKGGVSTPSPTTSAFSVSLSGPLPVVPEFTAPQAADVATPELISGVQATASNFAVFFIDPKRVSASLAMSTLSSAIGPGFKPCQVKLDVNATPITCGAGLVQFGSNELFTAKDSITPGLTELPVKIDPSNAASEVYVANYMTPQSATGVTVHVHFNEPVSQFLMRVGSGQLAAHAVYNLKFTVGVEPGGSSVTQVLAPDNVNLGAEWVGVQVAAGIQDLWITPDADLDQYLAADDPQRITLTHAWNANLISVVPTRLFTAQP